MRLFDTYSKSLVELPAAPGPVRMYFCGPTVYARAHVGNARPFVIGMWLRSWLRSQGYDATLVHNITDVNDKIYDAAPGASAALAEQATAWYLEDTGDLGLGMPDHMPKVTDHIPGIVALHRLADRGGSRLCGRRRRLLPRRALPGVRAALGPPAGPGRGAGAEPAQGGPRDFALWKANKPGEDTAWDAPWGRGRPGWHIECSAMAEELLGPAFEIHGGGLDLVFPHHENELAQSRALGHPFAQIWAHNGLLQFTGEKMSKSVGNIATHSRGARRVGARDAAALLPRRALAQAVDFSPETMAQARAQVATLSERVPPGSERERSTGPPGKVSSGRSTTTSTRPTRLRSCTIGVDAATRSWTQRSPSSVSASRLARPRRRRIGRGSSSSRERGRFAHVTSATSRRPIAARRARGRGWEMRDEPDGYKLVRKP